MPDRWVIVLVLVLVAVFVVLALLPREVRLYRRASHRGGRLELDTPEARAATADPDDWFAPWARIPCLRCGRTPASLENACEGCPRLTLDQRLAWRRIHGFPVEDDKAVSALRRCNPEHRVHYHQGGERCQCGQVSSVHSPAGYALHPFAARDSAPRGVHYDEINAGQGNDAA